MFLTKMLTDLGGEPYFTFFTFRDVNPVSGRRKHRVVGSPNGAMRIVHQRFLAHLRHDDNRTARQDLLSYATSSSPGDSPLKNAKAHLRNRHFYLVDFKNAYGCVDPEKLAGVLAGLRTFRGVSIDELGTFLKRHFFEEGLGLVQGGIASPDLFNLYVGALVDVPVSKVAEKNSIEYTRYLDDLTFSSASPITDQMRRQIRAPILEAGVPINHRKCERADLTKRTVRITGFGIADGGFLFVPRRYVRKINGLIHLARKDRTISMPRIRGMIQPLLQLSREQRTTAYERKVIAAFRAFEASVRYD